MEAIGRLILASGSPRRSELLRSLGAKFDVIAPETEERMDESLSPEALVAALAKEKALSVSGRSEAGDVLIAADTLVFFKGAPLSKPIDEQDAVRMLRLLSGEWHEVFTGLALLKDGALLSGFERTRVKFKPLFEREISAYVRTGEPLDKAGAYGAQGKGALFIDRIEGDYFNVVGLPLHRLYEMLLSFGVDLLPPRGVAVGS